MKKPCVATGAIVISAMMFFLGPQRNPQGKIIGLLTDRIAMSTFEKMNHSEYRDSQSKFRHPIQWARTGHDLSCDNF